MRRLFASLFLITITLAAGMALDAGDPPYAEVPRVQPEWAKPVGGSIEWMRVTSLGRLVVASSGGLYGIDPDDGKMSWQRDKLGNLDPGHYQEIPGTALIVAGSDGARSRFVILDSISGAVLFDSRAAGIVSLVGQQVLYETGGLVILGRQEGDLPLKLFMVDLATGKQRWVNDEPFGTAGKLAGALSALAGLVQAVAAEAGDLEMPNPMVEVGPDAFLLDSGGEIRKFDSADGKVLWKIRNQDGDGSVRFYRSPHRADAVYVGSEIVSQTQSDSQIRNTKYMAYRLSDGAAMWDKSIKVKGAPNSPVFLADGLILSPGGNVKGKIKFVEYASGRSTWGKKGKGIESQGGIVDHDPIEAGLVVTTGFDSAWTDRGTEYFLNVLDLSTGTYRFAKALKVRGRMLSTETVPAGVLYVTTRESGIFDPGTGKLSHERLIRTDGFLVTSRRGDRLYAFSRSDGALYSLSTSDGTQKRLTTTPVKLEGKDVPRSLDVRDDAILLVAHQTVVGFGHDGTVRFQRYYPAPRHPGWLRALMIAQSVRAGMAAAASGVSSAAFGQAAASQSEGSIQRETAQAFSEGYGRMAEGYAGLSESYAREAGRRFRASAEANDFVFMMVRLKGANGLAQVDKRTGEIVGMIHLGRDKEPVYQVDDVAQRVYYLDGGNEIVGYGFDVPAVAARK